MPKIIMTIVEGQTEEAIVLCLKKHSGYRLGRVNVLNLGEEKNIERVLSSINCRTTVYIVVDFDIYLRPEGRTALEQLEKNINYLIDKTKGKCFVVTQEYNLEDELIKGLSLSNVQDLCDHFGAEGMMECKKKLLKMHVDNLKQKIERLNHDDFWNTLLLEKHITNEKVIKTNICLKQVPKYK